MRLAALSIVAALAGSFVVAPDAAAQPCTVCQGMFCGLSMHFGYECKPTYQRTDCWSPLTGPCFEYCWPGQCPYTALLTPEAGSPESTPSSRNDPGAFCEAAVLKAQSVTFRQARPNLPKTSGHITAGPREQREESPLMRVLRAEMILPRGQRPSGMQ